MRVVAMRAGVLAARVEGNDPAGAKQAYSRQERQASPTSAYMTDAQAVGESKERVNAMNTQATVPNSIPGGGGDQWRGRLAGVLAALAMLAVMVLMRQVVNAVSLLDTLA